ncbi:MAG TPA: ATP-binding cassette domain-containing protein [Tepidisphaeraceae bacterium]|nr:ATP-binding cassette domain-containing protein [Tepidisphaeraceae bacterium]
MHPQPIIDLQHITLQRGDTTILRDVSWTVAPHTCAAIFGPNGSGKSTLTRVISGYMWPTSGDVHVLGQHYGEADLPALRHLIRVVQPGGQFDVEPTLTAYQVILTGFFATLGLYHQPTPAQHTQAEELLSRVGLTKLRDHPYQTLSNGEKVRSLIARALTGTPELLLLDEPTAGLDLLAREQVLATIQRLFDQHNPPTVILITHHVEELPPITSNILLLDQGAAAASGPPAQVLNSILLSKVYRCPITIRQSAGRFYAEVTPNSWSNLL